MKLSFSTHGWPFSLDECVNLAKEMRYDGLELSAGSLDVFDRTGAPLSPARLHETVRDLNEQSLSISALTAGETWTADEALSLIALAHDLRAPHVVLPLKAAPEEAAEIIAPCCPSRSGRGCPC